MEEFIGAAAKTMDEYDVLGNDGWLSSVPFGKLAGFLVKQMVEINDLDKALRRAVGFSIGAAFSQGLLRNKLKPTIQEEDYKAFRADLKRLLANKEIGGQDFAVADFNNSTIVQAFRSLLDGLLDTAILEEASRNRVKRFVSDYGKINFVRLLEQNKTVYGKLVEHLQSESYQLALEQASKEKYYSELRNMYTEVTLNDDQGMTLDAIYVEPKFKVFEKCLKAGTYHKDNKAFVSQDGLLIGWTLPDLLLAWLEGKPLSNKFKEPHPRFILLYGYPGQGKTSLCKRLLYDLGEEGPLQHPHYFARFRNLEKPEGLRTELLYTLANHLTEEKDLHIDRKALRSSFLLLDGLDELLMKNRLKSSDVEDICGTILEQSGRHDEMKVLVTSRYGYVESENLSPDEVLILQIDEMNLIQQTTWLQKYKAFHEQCWLNKERLAEINHYNSDSYLKELITQPILLHMVASLANPISNEANRALVYQTLFDQITDPRKWKKEGQVPALKGLEANNLREYLRELAYAVFITGENYIHKTEVEKLKATEKFRKKLKGSDFEKTLRALMIAFYFQEVNKKKNYSDDEDNHQYAIEFLHKSLQEYLTAEKIWFTLKKKFLFASEDGEYALEEGLEALQFCQELFGKQALSKEIMDYLREMIQNYENEDEKKELATRLISFMDYCLERNFAYSYQASKTKKSLAFGVQNFYGYFIVLVYLAPEMNLWGDIKARAQLASLLHLCTRFCFLELNLPGCYLPMTNLRNIELFRIDLRFADLRQANLTFADLRQANLTSANLTSADLRSSDLRSANLRSADLRSADLRQANLRQTDLRSANLTYANLRHADLRSADLTSANLTYTDLTSADLTSADLSDAELTFKQLKEVRTLYRSQGLALGIIEALKKEKPALFENYRKGD